MTENLTMENILVTEFSRKFIQLKINSSRMKYNYFTFELHEIRIINKLKFN